MWPLSRISAVGFNAVLVEIQEAEAELTDVSKIRTQANAMGEE
jgi:hypothetical protein